MRINENQKLILGPPGTGKTTTILNMIETLLESGVMPEKIAFVSFTRKAVNEAIERASDRFNLSKERFKAFKTIHALCFQELGMTRQMMIGRSDLVELGNLLGYRFSINVNANDGEILFLDDERGTQLMFLDNLSRILGCDHNGARLEANIRITLDEMDEFSRRYISFKQKRGKYDFTDLLEIYTNVGEPLNVDYFFVDEAQDLSLAQWRVLQKAAPRAKQVIICGDDDQSIFKWSGASLKTFLELEGEKEVLSKSYRLPVIIHNRAQNLIQRVRKRFEKEFSATDKEGYIDTVTELNQIKFEEGESVLFLARNTYLLSPIYLFLENNALNYTGRNIRGVDDEHLKAIMVWERLRKGEGISMDSARLVYNHLRVGSGILARGGKADLLRAHDTGDLLTYETLRDNYGLQGIPIWHEALHGISHAKREYYISLLKKGEKLTSESNVHVSTIHSAKGGEADHVIILTDMARRTHEHAKLDPDSEIRVAYVALTRARKRVTFVKPTGKNYFNYEE